MTTVSAPVVSDEDAPDDDAPDDEHGADRAEHPPPPATSTARLTR
jgi:hypothetical protein